MYVKCNTDIIANFDLLEMRIFIMAFERIDEKFKRTKDVGFHAYTVMQKSPIRLITN